MEEFILIIKEESKTSISDSDGQQLERSYKEWMNKLIEQGQYVHGNRLTTKQHQLAAGTDMLSDGPFVEPKELIGGIVIVKASSLEEARKIATSCPMHQYHDIEIRATKNAYPG